jgi:uncharacterized protein YecT (DUF1311 family)
MIYANGLGTPRDTALALRMGCEAAAYHDGLKDADLDRLQAALRGPADPSSPYDVCNAVPPKVKNVALCAHFDSLMNRQRVISSISLLSADWTAEQKRLMKEVEDTEDRFSRSYARVEAPLEVNYDGFSGPDASHLRQKSAFDDAFLGGLRWICAQKASNRNAGRDNRNAALLDMDLNRQYNTLMEKLREQGVTASPNATDERRIEREWIAFRDTWVAFVKARFGADQAEDSREQMTAERTRMLAALSANFDPPSPEAARQWHRICADVQAAELPADFTPEPAKQKVATCPSYRPYYGIGSPVDFKAALTCAISERDEDLVGHRQGSDSSEIKDTVRSSVLLAMLYANGQGVARNVRLAQRFACEAIDFGLIDTERFASADPEEEKGETAAAYLKLLQAVAYTGPSKIDLCGDVEGPTRALSQCDQIADALKDQKRASAFDTLRNKLTPEQKPAFDRLMAASRAFFAAHVNNEIPMTGHGVSNGQVQSEYADREAAFLTDLERFEHGDLPHVTPAEYAADDRALNTVYAKAVASVPDEGDDEHQVGNGPTRPSVRATERLWIAYRNALADFGTLRYPKIVREAWLAFVTVERTNELNDM